MSSLLPWLLGLGTRLTRPTRVRAPARAPRTAVCLRATRPQVQPQGLARVRGPSTRPGPTGIGASGTSMTATEATTTVAHTNTAVAVGAGALE